MNLVYIHIGNLDISNYSPNKDYTYTSIPTYAWHSIHQSRKYYDGPIYVVLPKSDINDINIQRAKLYRCELIPFEDFLTGNQTTNITATHSIGAAYSKEFLKTRLELANIPYITQNHFGCVTFLRLFVLCELIRNYQLKDVWHLENDNLIFDKFPIITDEKIFYADVSDTEASAGIVFIPNANLACTFADLLLKEYSKDTTKSEMNVLKAISKNPNIEFFYKNIFDGASYGQFLEGDNQGHGPGHISPQHYAASMLSTETVRYEDGLPVLYDQRGLRHNLFNLHFHNKSQIYSKVHNPMEDITVGIMSAPTLRERYTACALTWMQEFKNKYIFCGDSNTDSNAVTLPCKDDYHSALAKQFLGLKYMYEHSPTDWYFFSGCDTYVYGKQLEKVLDLYNPNMPLYLGGEMHSGDFTQLYRYDTPCKRFASGGPGIILSKELVKQIYPSLEKCMDIWHNAASEFNSNAHPAAGDVALAYILWKHFNIFLTTFEDKNIGLYHCQPKDYYIVDKNPISFHYIQPDLMIKLHQQVIHG